MPDYRRAIRRETSVLEYLQAGEDRFFLREHLSNWIDYDGEPVKILAVKYEALGDHLDEIMDFLECPRPFQVRPRSSRFHDEPPEVRAGLEAMYGSLKEKIDGLPSLIRVSG